MVLIRIDKNKMVTSCHHQPDLLTEEEIKKGILIDYMPKAEKKFGSSGTSASNLRKSCGETRKQNQWRTHCGM